MLESLFNKNKDVNACNFIKKRLQNTCFPFKFVKRLRTPSFTEHLWWLHFGSQKTDTGPFSYQKTDTKRNLWVNIAQLMAHTTVVYVAVYLAIMLPVFLA